MNDKQFWASLCKTVIISAWNRDNCVDYDEILVHVTLYVDHLYLYEGKNIISLQNSQTFCE